MSVDETGTSATAARATGGAATGLGDGLFAMFLLAAACAAYYPALRGSLLWDDDRHVTGVELRSLSGLGRIWCDVRAAQQYYPLLHTAFWIEHRLWGDRPLGYHLVNVVLHALAAWLAFLVLRRLEVPGARWAAAIFALHPVQVESVAWISEQKNTLSAVFYLSALLVYLRFDRSRSKLCYGAAVALFAAALLSKTVTATLPGALLLILWWKRGRLSWTRDVLPLIPWLVLGCAAGLFTAWWERVLGGAAGAEYALTLFERILIAGRALGFYLAKLAWPADLMFIYPRWSVRATAWWQYLYPVAAGATLLGLWRLRRQTRAPAAAALFFVGTLFPVLGFFNIYPFRFSFVADHFQYLASLGIIAFASSAAAQVLRDRRAWIRNGGRVMLTAIVVVLLLLSRRQCRMYTDLETLYRTTIARNPSCAMAHNNLGTMLWDSGRSGEALEHFREAVEIKADYIDALNNLGLALVKLGRTAESIEYYLRSVRIQPDANAENNIGVTLFGMGRLDEAIQHYRAALRLRPGFAEVHTNWGNALCGQRRFREAIDEYRTALALKPDWGNAERGWDEALYNLGQFEECIEHCRRARLISPDNAEVESDWGNALLRLGRYADAAEHYRAALKSRAEYAEAHSNLGVALTLAGSAGQALEHYQKAIQISPHYIDAQYNWGNTLLHMGRLREAAEHYQAVLRDKPDHLESLMAVSLALYRVGEDREAIRYGNQAENLLTAPTLFDRYQAWLLATREPADGGDPERAVALAERVCRWTNRQDFSCLDALAAAYASAGRFPEAVIAAKEAQRLAMAAGEEKTAKRIQRCWGLYARGKPYRERSAGGKPPGL